MAEFILAQSEFGDLNAAVVYYRTPKYYSGEIFESYNVRLSKRIECTEDEQKLYGPYLKTTVLVRSFGTFERASKVYQELTRNKTITILKYS
jgi:hypothetical protein